MNRISLFLLSAISYLLIGHVLGLVIGFTVFEPDSDMYALLSPVFVVVGAVLNLLPAFRKRVPMAFGALLGFYVGMLLSILLWGNPEANDFLEAIELGATAILLSVVLAVIGGVIGARTLTEDLYVPASVLMIGGFLGGALFVSAGIATSRSMVGVAPFVFASGLVLGFAVWWLQQHSRVTT